MKKKPAHVSNSLPAISESTDTIKEESDLNMEIDEMQKDIVEIKADQKEILQMLHKLTDGMAKKRSGKAVTSKDAA